MVCLPIPTLGLDASAGPVDAPVCAPVAPDTEPIDASPPRIFDGAAPPVPVDAGDAGDDAGPQDAGDGG